MKQDNTRAYGVDVREVGENFDLARKPPRKQRKAAACSSWRIPFDDWRTIAGQGTIGLEMSTICRRHARSSHR
ncbi:MAG: hypothetical protein R2855_12595 [Thermomicrobiales bacterium]